MSLRLCFSIDNLINPEDLLTLVLQEPQLKLAHSGPRERREKKGGLPPIVETHVILPSYDFLITVFVEDELWRQFTFELMQVAPRVGLSIRFGGEADTIEFYQIFASLLKKLEGDALISFDGASPILLRRAGVIIIETDAYYRTDASLRALLPPPVIEGKIPW